MYRRTSVAGPDRSARSLRVGVVGTGFMGRTHARAWSNLGNPVIGHWSPTDGRGAGEALLGARATSLATLIRACDVIDVCSPTDTHLPVALEAIAGGCHVICEKPLALTSEDASHMAEAADRAGLFLLPAHVVRYFPEYAHAQEAVQAGVIGPPSVVRTTRVGAATDVHADSWYSDDRRSGGLILDLMIHDLDFIRWLAGPVTRIHARSTTYWGGDWQVSMATAITRHRDGAVAHLVAASSGRPGDFATGFEIAGPGGLIRHGSRVRAPIHVAPLPMRGASPDLDAGHPRQLGTSDPWALELEEFMAVCLGQATARVTAADGVAAIRIAEAAILSTKNGKAVEVAMT